jgi:3-deoxy-7-phosphoheptulonate synthase
MGNAVLDRDRASAVQQPDWENPSQVRQIRALLASCAPLVNADDVAVLRAHLARVAMGEAHVLQAGDCAEDPTECTARPIQRKSALLDLLATTLHGRTGGPVLRVGRIAGQFAKPRSQRVEQVGGLELPVYRGHMVNRPEPEPASRRPDPLRMLTGYMAASESMHRLGWRGGGPRSSARLADDVVWTSHEALLLDYELPMVREPAAGGRLLSSTHWPWIGERSRQPDGPHVALLAGVANPVGCKVGPTTGTGEILELCQRLDPEREPGRLTFIARMGADLVAERLPALVDAVRSAGHPVIWLCDPMHGNTVRTPDGGKTRVVETVIREVRGFRYALRLAGGVAGGLHLEATPDDVAECVGGGSTSSPAAGRYTSLCDPRLNPHQAVRVVSAWSDVD